MNKYEDCIIEPGVIDVLIPNFADSRYTLPLPISTHSYSPNHYDSQKAIFVNHGTESSYSHHHISDDEAQSLSVQAFEPYICQSKPIKISKFMEFRRFESTITHHDKDYLVPSYTMRHDATWCQGTLRDKADSLIQTTRFPLHLLDTHVEVLLKYFRKDHVQSQQVTSAHINRKRKRSKLISDNIIQSDTLSLDEEEEEETLLELYTRYLSILDPDRQAMDPHPIPIFLGQGNSLTTTLSLRDIFYQSFNNNSIETLQVYIAQRSLLSCRHSSDYYSQSFISCDLDGRLYYSKEVQEDKEDTPLAALAPYIRAPSYLLSSKVAQIVEVNLWYSPLECCTNYHYDSNHNLLMVLSGTKTVELAPPDVIRPAALYSDHANHPALLYRVTSTSNHRKGETLESNDDRSKCTSNSPRNENLSGKYNTSSSVVNKTTDFYIPASTPMDECIETRTRLLQSSFVVSVSAGEALYIPAGWWHRVESSDFCMAINIWFDSPSLSVTSSLQRADNNHMMPFYIREFTRTYFELHKRKIAQQLIESDKCTWIQRLIHEHNVEPSLISRLDEQLNSSSREEMDLNIWLSSEILTLPLLSSTLNFLLLLFDSGNSQHRSNAMKLLDEMYDLCCSHALPFYDLILTMECSTCYNLSRIWENHEDKNRVQLSCNLLFERYCYKKSNASVRHIFRGSDEFNRRIMVTLFQILGLSIV